MFPDKRTSSWKLLLCTMIMISLVYDIVNATEKKKDYYEILGVSRDATQKDIKRAFRKLAIKYHPDKNKEKDAEDKFRDMAKAYDTLSNAEKRKKYDQFGEDDGQPDKFSQGDFHDIFGTFDQMFQQFHHPHQHHQEYHHHHDQHGQHSEHVHQYHHSDGVPHFTFSFDDLWDLDEPSYDSNHHGIHFGDSFFSNFMHDHQPAASQQQNCKRTTKQVGNTIIQTTECY